MIDDLKLRLLENIDQIDQYKIKKFNVVLMPDFFTDHILLMNDFDKDFLKIKKIYEQGGGNIPDVIQSINQGGNATNTALGLAKLGIESHLICKTDYLGFHFLKYFLGQAGVNLKNVKTNGKIAITTAMEFDKGSVNVMIGDTGSVSDFDFNQLDENDLELISNSDITCVTNWSLNNNGTELARDVFKFSKKNNVKTFLDIGDPSHKKNELKNLIKSVLNDKKLDILGLNENELMHLCNIKKFDNEKEILTAAESFKEKIDARMDLHTEFFSCSIKNECQLIPTIKPIKIHRSTGAGDAWNAGNLFAELFDFKDDERLLFANIVAGYYISSFNPVHPKLYDIKKMLCKIK